MWRSSKFCFFPPVSPMSRASGWHSLGAPEGLDACGECSCALPLRLGSARRGIVPGPSTMAAFVCVRRRAEGEGARSRARARAPELISDRQGVGGEGLRGVAARWWRWVVWVAGFGGSPAPVAPVAVLFNPGRRRRRRAAELSGRAALECGRGAPRGGRGRRAGGGGRGTGLSAG